MEKKTDPYRLLFDHMDQEHGLILLDSEMADIIHLVEKMQQVRPQGAATDDEIKAAWKKRMGINFDEYGAMQDYCFYQQGYDDAASVIRQGAVWVKGEPKVRKLYHARFKGNIDNDLIYDGIIEPVPNPVYWQAIASGVRISIKASHIVEYLDESATPVKESDAADVIEFAEWAAEIAWFDEEYRLWNFFEEGKMVDGRFRFTTSEFYELFNQSK